MKRLCALVLLVVIGLSLTGCQTRHHSGSREYVPGKGWLHTD